MLSESGRCSWSFLGPVCSVLPRLQGLRARQKKKKHHRPSVVKVGKGSRSERKWVLEENRHCRERTRANGPTEDIAPLPRTTGVQVQSDTSSRSADVEKDLLKEMVERRGACRMPQACISGAVRFSTACGRGCSMSKEESSAKGNE